MYRKITDFPGFEIKAKEKRKGFNPFEELFGENPSEKVVQQPLTQTLPTQILPTAFETNLRSAPIVSKAVETKDIIKSIIQDSTIIIHSQQSSEDPFRDFTSIKEESKKEIVQKIFIQPRNSEGQRGLFKYPDMPVLEDTPNPFYILVGTEDKRNSAYLLQFDGAANPNPGPASSGAVLWSPKHSDGFRRVLFESGKFLGKATNNIAEVQGLLLALQIAVMRGVREILIEGDSELIIFQQIGKYKVSDRNLKVWWAQIQAAMMDEQSFDWIAIRQVPRELNERADSITKEVLSKRENFQRA